MSKIDSGSRHDATTSGRITALPYEVLADIFVMGRDIIYDMDKTDERPLILMQYLAYIPAVCSNWRQISISTSALWTIVLCPSYSSQNITPVLHYLQTLMERSREQLLIWEVTVTVGDLSQHIERIVKTVYPHIERCCSISMNMAHQADIFLPFPGKLKNLTSLSVLSPTEHTENLTEPGSAPNLREFRYRGRRPWFRNILRENLQLIETGWLDVEQSMAFLASCSSVQRANIHFYGYGEQPTDPPAVLEGLRTLTISSHLNTPFRAFVATPSLEDLTLMRTWSRKWGTGDEAPGTFGGYWDPLLLHCSV